MKNEPLVIQVIESYLTDNISLPGIIDSINYSIFVLGAVDREQFNETEIKTHLFRLRDTVAMLMEIDEVINLKNTADDNEATN